MTTLFLEYPRFAVALSVPEEAATSFRQDFAPWLISRRPLVVHAEYRVQLAGTGVSLVKNGVLAGTFPSMTELTFFLEEDLEISLIERLGDWVGFHAGAAAIRDSAIVVVGHPDTGKTTTTFQLVELGLELLCEEVTPIDPATIEVQPFPQTLTLARGYAEEFASRYSVKMGNLSYYGPEIARYAAGKVRKGVVPLKAIIFPSFDPSFEPTIERVSPGQVLTELLPYCFPPALGEEWLYDNVIRIIERCRLFRLRTCGIESTRALLGALVSEFS
jgi:hypothetical protein